MSNFFYISVDAKTELRRKVKYGNDEIVHVNSN